MVRRTRGIVVLLALVVLGAAGCSSGDEESPTVNAPATSASTTDTLSGDLNVFAASSLTEAFTAMGTTFESRHPRVKVTFNFAASSALAEQINQGAPADVFVSADETNMKKVTDAGSASAPTT